MENFKVKDLIEVLGDFYIYIIDNNKTFPNGDDIVYWEGETDNYFKERPFGDCEVEHISYCGEYLKTIKTPYGESTFTNAKIAILINKEN